jgi:hypothetical protein
MGNAERRDLERTAGDGSMTEWQPIATAPRDGTDILVTMTHGLGDEEWDNIQWVDYCLTDENWIIFKRRIDIPFPPTHWMPLPDPPNGDA